MTDSCANFNRRQMLLGLLAAAGTGTAWANTAWPNKAIRMIVPGPAGSGGDIFARMLLPPLQSSLKESLYVENKAGANGIIGNDHVAKAQADGYTLLFSPSSSIAINPIIQPKMPYDAMRDLAPVAQVGAAGVLLVANPATGFKNLADMVQYAKAHPGRLAYGSWGSGSTGHLVMEGIKAHYGLDMPHVPYKGTAVELGDLLANTIGVGFMDIASPIPHVRSGKLRALGATGSARGPALQDVPTLTEQGYTFDADGWYGVFAPAKTDPQDHRPPQCRSGPGAGQPRDEGQVCRAEHADPRAQVGRRVQPGRQERHGAVAAAGQGGQAQGRLSDARGRLRS